MENKHNLTWWLAKALERSAGEYSPGEADYTATSLIKPPYIYALEREHEPEKDVANQFDAFDGNCYHNELERLLKDDPNILVEKRYSRWIKVDGAPGKKDFLISGQIDLYDLYYDTLNDHKRSKMYKYMNTSMEEFEIQLNINKWIMKANGFNPQHLQIAAFPKDFNKNDAKNKESYPDIPFFPIEFPFWHDEDVEAYIREAVIEKEKAVRGNARLCSPEERWQRPTQYAVMKNGQKKAVRVFNKQEEAEEYLDFHEDNKLYLETRLGRNVRCEEYCDVAPWCSFYKEVYGDG